MMKHKGSSYYCRWFTLFLLAMGIVLVSPDIHTNFANNCKQTITKGTTATTIAKTTTTTTTIMQANTLRTIKMLEAMGFIDANRYNVNGKDNNNNNNNYNSNMLIANTNRNSKNSKSSNKMYISAPSNQKMWSEQLQQLADSGPPEVELEQGLELDVAQDMKEHMISTPQSMTIMVEKPTMVKYTTTSTTAVATTTISTKTPSVSTAITLATSKPTTTTITIATTAITTRSGSTIKLPPDNVANINVSGINMESTMIYKQSPQRQQQQQHQQHQQRQQHHWQQRQQRQQRQHERQQRHQQQLQYAQAQVLVSGRRAQQPQKYIGNTLLGDNGSTQASASMVVAMPAGRDGEVEGVTATSQTQITINGNSNSNSERIVDGITTPITATTTTTISPTDTIILMPTPATTTAAAQSNQYESVRILYDYKASDAATDNLKRTTETDAQMVVARHEEMEVDRQYQHKFASSYLEATGNNDNTAAAYTASNTHNYAALEQLSAEQYHQHQQQQRRRWVRQAGEEEPIDKCRQFNEGDAAKNEFYSPDYPNNYPKNINCTRVITASPGQIIRLDFRNSFHIEAKEECKFDVLEIRDGQYGFSNLIGKFCGTDFPPEITSKERFLWLHFHSDESIEYSGFTAVYEFMDRSKEAPTTDLNCTIEKGGFEDFVNSTDVPEGIRETVIKNRVPLDCIWRIQVKENWKIQMKFMDFRLVKPNDCDANFLDIFPEETVMPLRKKNFCGSAGEGVTSDTNTLHIRFFAEPAAINSTFSILYTAFRDRGPERCADDEYDCDDATCISAKLRCNSRDNCKFRWDEEKCDKQNAEESEHIIIVMIVFGLILGGMILTFLVNCIRKIMHDQKIIREHIRQSKESKLNELGRSSKARSRENLSSTMPRPKRSQASLQILNDTSNRYYREVVPMSRASSKSDLKEREHSILRQRNDIVVQTSFCVDDNSSETTVEAAMAANACDMGCQTRESLFATPLMHQSSMSSLKDKASQHSRSRFSTFGYEAAQPRPPSQPTSGRGGQLAGLNIREAQEYIEMHERHPAPRPKMPHMHRMDALPPTPPTPAVPPEMCHHHHQHAAHTHTHTQPMHQQHQQHQQQQLSMQPTKESAGGRSTAPTTTTTVTTASSAQGKGKPKLSQSTAYIDIRNSAPDVIIMTSH